MTRSRAGLLLVIASCLLATAESAYAQEPWSQAMQTLSPGVVIRATLDDGTDVRGTFQAADDQSMTLSVAGSDRRLMRAQVRRVSVANGTKRRRRETIGMIVGAVAAGLLVGSHCRDSSCSNNDALPMMYFGSLIFAGGALGHVLPPGTAWREIYHRPSP